MIKNAIECKKCGSDNCMVTDTRTRKIRKIGETIYRRRECLDCGYKWSTAELYITDIERLLEVEFEKNLADCERLVEFLDKIYRRKK